MAGDDENAAPYAPAENVVRVIRHARERRLPDVLNTRELDRLGIHNDGTARKVLRAFRFLKLIDPDGAQLPSFDTLRRASSDEYPQILAGIIRDAYSEVFSIIGDDPEGVSDRALDDAFRIFNPQAQRSRMVLLFQVLCHEAGLLAKGPTERRGKSQQSSTTSGARTSAKSNSHTGGTKGGAAGTKDDPATAAHEASAAHAPQGTRSPSADGARGPAITVDDEGYALLLVGLIRQLPCNHRWTERRRERWLQAVEVNVDILVDVVDEDEEADEPVR